MAPDKDPSFEGMAPGLGGDASGLDQTKAKLDDSELSDDLPKSLQKVDLDLDDAPFLEDEEEPEPEPVAAASGEDDAGEVVPAPWWKKKKIVVPSGSLLLVLVGLTIYYLFFMKQEPPPAPPQPEIVQEEPAPAPVEPPAPPEISIALDPFLVEGTDGKGQVRFLTVKFATTTTNPDLEKEMQTNVVVLRDAIYYYLKNKNLVFLTDEKNGEILKKDVLSVINQFLSADQLDNLQIEEYVVK